MKRIVVAVDGSENADRALGMAADLAKRYEATLTLVSVVPPVVVATYGGPVYQPTIPESVHASYEEVLASRRVQAEKLGAPRVETVLREGIVVEELLAYLDQEAPDLLVMGSRGLSAGKRLFMGSVSDALVHHARCPVLVVRHP